MRMRREREREREREKVVGTTTVVRVRKGVLPLVQPIRGCV
jgi:hypothetical protein